MGGSLDGSAASRSNDRIQVLTTSGRPALEKYLNQRQVNDHITLVGLPPWEKTWRCA
jgi:hypothetical protein